MDEIDQSSRFLGIGKHVQIQTNASGWIKDREKNMTLEVNDANFEVMWKGKKRYHLHHAYHK